MRKDIKDLLALTLKTVALIETDLPALMNQYSKCDDGDLPTYAEDVVIENIDDVIVELSSTVDMKRYLIEEIERLKKEGEWDESEEDSNSEGDQDETESETTEEGEASEDQA
jgi:hypothetical protein